MNLTKLKHLKSIKFHSISSVSICVFLFVILLLIRTLLLPNSFVFGVPKLDEFDFLKTEYARLKFLQVPQIVWGLNNQKIAFARACLTARMLNRTLLMPSLSASLFYKEIDQLQPISFEKVFKFESFNTMCKGFVQLSRYSGVRNQSDVIELQKGSGRRWTPERDFDQLKEFSSQDYDAYETIRVVGKNPFLWHDHWPVSDYGKVFECLVLVDEISKEAEKVVSKIRQFEKRVQKSTSDFDIQSTDSDIQSTDSNIQNNDSDIQSTDSDIESTSMNEAPYVAIHMRIEKDWMIHCKKREQRSNLSDICSSKQEITTRVPKISALTPPTTLYLAVANELLEDNSILTGWKKGMYPVDKKHLGVTNVYKKHPYLIQAAIDYEVCLRADVFVGNSYSTFSGLLVLERTQRMVKTGEKWPSYAYNLRGENDGPRPWTTDLSGSSLHAISYGSNNVSC